MWKFDFQFETELTKQLEILSNFNEIAPKILGGAVEILEDEVKKETRKHRDTGDLYNSIKSSKAKKNKYGWFVSVYPSGKDKKGVRNMAKMAYFEFGTSKMPASPILTKALNNANSKVTDKMQELFNKAMEGIL
jgi:HK97 gp10 family phage protein